VVIIPLAHGIVLGEAGPWDTRNDVGHLGQDGVAQGFKMNSCDKDREENPRVPNMLLYD
jgi:hypothetical protein